MARTQFPNKAPQPMPGNVRGALQKHALMDAYLERPAYQKDDYLKWIATAAGPAAKQQRLDQMVDELKKGGVFKGEPWTPPEPVAKPAVAAAASKPAPKAAATPASKAAGNTAATPASKPAAKASSAAKPAAKPAPAAKPVAKK